MIPINHFCCGFLLFIIPFASAESFTYDRNDMRAGPFVWGKINPQCAGFFQSPINIQTKDVTYGRPFSTQYMFRDPRLWGKFRNNGHYPTFEMQHGYKLTGVPHHERDIYELFNFHFHFGRASGEGTEHLIDGKAYSGEFHMIHYNTKYGTHQNAAKFPDGRVVVAVFFQSGLVTNRPHMEAFLRRNLPLIRRNGLKRFHPRTARYMQMMGLAGTTLDSMVAPISLLPDSSHIYTYAGSTTTPPCSENIRWIVHRQPIILSASTIELARSCQTAIGLTQGKFGNFRPVQPIHGRLIEANFVPFRRNLVLSPVSILSVI